MRGRSRNKGPNPLTRSYESNGPDVKVRGTAQHVADKYSQLARDALASGDPVMAENYFQHAEHYYRIIAAAQEQLRQQYGFPQRGYDDESDEGEDEGDYRSGSDRLEDLDPSLAPQPSFGRGDGQQPRRDDRGGRPDRQERHDRQDRQERQDRPERRDDRRERFQRDRRDGGPREQYARGGEQDGRGGDRFADRGEAPQPRAAEPPPVEGREPRQEPRQDVREEGRRERPRRERRRPEAEDESAAASLPAFVTRPTPVAQPAAEDEAPAPKATRTRKPRAAEAETAEGEEAAKPRRRTRRKAPEPGSGDAEAAE
ncbi:DUF4167 domain-containing protein [Salinarimonas sp.]|uniref:DUF4167 domain-containing protein n=1 Tax=Salinarimonas sp. TaxID=2766526 RepID=UPI0032D94ED3